MPDKGGTLGGRFRTADCVAPDILIGVGAIDEHESKPCTGEKSQVAESPKCCVTLVIDESENECFTDAPIADQVEIVLGQLRLVEFLTADVRGKIQRMNLRPRQVEGNEPVVAPL